MKLLEFGSAYISSCGKEEIFLFSVEKEASRLAELFSYLSFQERRVRRRISNRCHQRESILARGLLRELLGKKLGLSPKDVPISFTPEGKPVLEGAYSPPTKIHFSVTHARGLIAIALSEGRPVGIDVECRERRMPRDHFVAAFFHPVEQGRMAEAGGEEERRTLFYQIWTAKEALLKALGIGLRMNPAECNTCRLAEAWHLEQFEVSSPGQSWIGALVCPRHPVPSV